MIFIMNMIVNNHETFSQEKKISALIRIQGNKFVDQQGKETIFRGIAFSDPNKLQKAGHWNEEYFKTAYEWGANIIRIPVHPIWWRAQGTQNYLTLLDQGIQWAKKYNLFVIIDWHSIGNLKTELFQDTIYDTDMKETLTFWRTIANRYKDEPIVVFYEIYNEPTTYNGQLGEMTWTEWKSIANQIIKLIFAFDKKAIPLVGGFNWAYDLTPVNYDPIDIPGIAYTVHPYPQKRSEPWEIQWDIDFGFVKDKYPVFATEFGFEKKGFIPFIGDENYGRHIIDYFNKKGISWTVWCFDPDWTPTLIHDWNFSPTDQGKFFKEVLKSKK